jgi:hypothetical protein
MTRRPKTIGTTEVPKFIESVEVVTVVPTEASADTIEKPKTKKTTEEQPKLLSPPVVVELPKLSTTAPATPKKRRMASVLDVVLESMKTPTPAVAEVSGKKIKDTKEETTASAASAHAKAGPSRATPIRLMEESLLEKSASPAPEAPPQGNLEYIVRHASEKELSSEQISKVQHYAKELKYPQGPLVYGGDNEDDFLYYLPDSKEINFCREMMDNIGY